MDFREVGRAAGVIAGQVAQRAGLEARFAGTLLVAANGGLLQASPARLVTAARGALDYGMIGGVLDLAASSYADSPAIIDERGSLTFDELDRRSTRLANALARRGVRAGDGLGLMCRNHRGFYETVFAGAKLGVRTLLLNTDFAAPQLADVCRREDVHVLVHDEEFGAVADGLELKSGRYLAWTDAGGPEGSGAATADGDPGTLEELIRSGGEQRLPRPVYKQRIVLLTSGTTGTPKGAPRDIALSLALPGGFLSKIPLRGGRTTVLAAPAFHAWGLLSAVLALGLGNTIVTARRTDPAFVLDALERYHADTLITVPILLSRVLDAAAAEDRRRPLPSLRVIAVSGSALSPDLARRAMDRFGDVLHNLYGSTEVAYATIATPEDLRAAPGTVGRPPHGTTIVLLDDAGNPVAPGGTGRIFVGSTMQFEGYTGGGSKETVDGMMSTGDVGHLDAAGRLFVDGRDDDMIVSGGENVFPREVEELLVAHDGIEDAAVVGVPDEQFGKRLRAYVVLAPGATLDEDAIKTYVKDNLARYKVPREVVFLDELPRNPAGKVVKRELPETQTASAD